MTGDDAETVSTLCLKWQCVLKAMNDAALLIFSTIDGWNGWNRFTHIGEPTENYHLFLQFPSFLQRILVSFILFFLWLSDLHLYCCGSRKASGLIANTLKTKCYMPSIKSWSL